MHNLKQYLLPYREPTNKYHYPFSFTKYLTLYHTQTTVTIQLNMFKTKAITLPVIMLIVAPPALARAAALFTADGEAA